MSKKMEPKCKKGKLFAMCLSKVLHEHSVDVAGVLNTTFI